MTEPLEILLPRKPYNVESLDNAIRAALGVTCFGIVARLGHVFAVLDPAATTEQQTQAIAIAEAHNPATPTPAQSVLANVRATAQTAVGVALADLTTAQRNALMAALLWRAGAIAPDSTIRPLSDWLR